MLFDDNIKKYRAEKLVNYHKVFVSESPFTSPHDPGTCMWNVGLAVNHPSHYPGNINYEITESIINKDIWTEQ